jgi:uncharacterized protein YndB with AHSA1/START domain
MESHTAKTQITVHARPARVWKALTEPALVKEYMMGADVKSDWKVGSELSYTGTYQGKPYEEGGVIRRIEPEKVLQATHFTKTPGKPQHGAEPAKQHLVTWELHENGGATVVTVTQDGIATADGAETTKRNWKTILEGLKKTAEG